MGNKKKIIVVDDDEDILFTITHILENANYEVSSFITAQSIVDGDYICPELFILDKRMPDMDGLDVCRTLRSKTISQKIPIIIISASPKFGSRAISAGASAFLEKPFRMAELISLVKKHIGD